MSESKNPLAGGAPGSGGLAQMIARDILQLVGERDHANANADGAARLIWSILRMEAGADGFDGSYDYAVPSDLLGESNWPGADLKIETKEDGTVVVTAVPGTKPEPVGVEDGPEASPAQ